MRQGLIALFLLFIQTLAWAGNVTQPTSNQGVAAIRVRMTVGGGAACDENSGELNQLSLFYPFNEGTGTSTADVSSGTHAGTLANTPTWITDGSCGNALRFATASSEYVTAANGPIIDTATDVWSIFVRWRSNDQDNCGLVSQADTAGTTPNMTIYYLGAGDGLNFAIRDGSSNDGSINTGDINTSNNQWHSAMWVSSSTAYRRAIVDGVQIAANTTSVDFGAGQLDNFTVGAVINTGVEDQCDADIDQVRVYAGRAFTNEEALALHNSLK